MSSNAGCPWEHSRKGSLPFPTVESKADWRLNTPQLHCLADMYGLPGKFFCFFVFKRRRSHSQASKKLCEPRDEEDIQGSRENNSL